MSMTISQRELRNDSGAVLREVQAGQTIIVTRIGAPVTEHRAVPQQQFLHRAAFVVVARRAPRVDYDRLRAIVDQSVDG